MRRVDLTIRPTDDLAAIRRLGVACGLDDTDRDDGPVLGAWGAYDGERLVGSIVLELFHGLTTVNWMAVDAAYRRQNVGARLYDVLEREAISSGTDDLWVTARSPAFFLALGFAAVRAGPEHDVLLEECQDCEQYRRGCEPQALTKRCAEAGSSSGPQ